MTEQLNELESLVLKKLVECTLNCKTYHAMDDNYLKNKAKAMSRHLEHQKLDDIVRAFDSYMEHGGDDMPSLKEIMEPLTPHKIYQMNNGPLGHGGLYAPDHPYIKQQEIAYQSCDSGSLEYYSVMMRAIDVSIEALQIEARNAPRITSGDDEPPRIDRQSSTYGFAKLPSCKR